MNATRTGRRVFLRHLIEMLIAMFAGMLVLGGITELVFAAAGSSLSDAPGSVRVMLMGFDMTVPMVAWMSYRGHSRARNESHGRLNPSIAMAASMIVPTLAAAALAAVGVLSSAAALGVQHAVMIPAMLGVMLWRYDEYSRAH